MKFGQTRKNCKKRYSYSFQVSSGDCPHLLFYGPSGSGKKTLILALLREIFGVKSEKVGYLSFLHYQHFSLIIF